MSLLSRLLGKPRRPRAEMRALWNAAVAEARKPVWYETYGVSDSLAGRFDMVTLVLAALLLRMEREPHLIEPSVRLTEIFIDDMDGQLRNAGVGDLSVGKHIGKLMGVLGGRLGALREALAGDEAALVQAAARNVTMAEGGDSAQVAAGLRAWAQRLEATQGADLLAGKVQP